MTLLTPLATLSSYSVGIAATTTWTTSMATTMSVAKDFFAQIFLHPTDNLIAVGILAVIGGGSIVGLAFLLKLVVEKFCPDPSKE
ncbi:MAG: hypothetical protein K940chlam9_00550 [Chlamydiae bacterium]|nr:hypothetical protein [Chlamydiota bacterium]